MPSTNDYLDLITSEHIDKPLYRAAVEALMAGPADIANMELELPSKFDLDIAAGVQLDSLGQWVGITRRVAIPLSGIYFTWDAEAVVGWDLGTWRGEFDPVAGIVVLNDADYRTLIRAKIAANSWDGTIPAAVAAYQLVLPEQLIVIVDNQDMSMDVLLIGPPLTAVERALILGDYLLLRPATIQVHPYNLLPPDTPIAYFSWDRDLEHEKGWDIGHWYKPGDHQWPPDVFFAFDVNDVLLTWDDDIEHGWDAACWPSALAGQEDHFAGWETGWWFQFPDFVFAWDFEDNLMQGWEIGSWYARANGLTFAWDVLTDQFGGWELGNWEGPLLPE